MTVAWPDSFGLPVNHNTIKNVVVPEMILYVTDFMNDRNPGLFTTLLAFSIKPIGFLL
jgi:hypothetical protein